MPGRGLVVTARHRINSLNKGLLFGRRARVPPKAGTNGLCTLGAANNGSHSPETGSARLDQLRIVEAGTGDAGREPAPGRADRGFQAAGPSQYRNATLAEVQVYAGNNTEPVKETKDPRYALPIPSHMILSLDNWPGITGPMESVDAVQTSAAPAQTASEPVKSGRISPCVPNNSAT